MNLREWFPSWVLLAAVLGVFSCSLDKPIQSPKGKNADELYKQGTSQLEQKNYRQAIETFYKLKYDFPSEAAAVMADLKIADAHYSNKEYAEAAEGYEEVRKMHPASPYIPYVVYMLGMCHYHRSLSVDRDQSETEKALAEFQYLLTHFPDTPYAHDSYQKAQECTKKLSDHEVYVGNFYFRMSKYQAAIQRYEAALAKYPNVPLEEEVLFQLAEAYQATKQPEKAARTLQVLSQQYPKGKYASKAQKLLQGELAHAASSSQQDSRPLQEPKPQGSAEVSSPPKGAVLAAASASSSTPPRDSGSSKLQPDSSEEKPLVDSWGKSLEEMAKPEDSSLKLPSESQRPKEEMPLSSPQQVQKAAPSEPVLEQDSKEKGQAQRPKQTEVEPPEKTQAMIAAGSEASDRQLESKPKSQGISPQLGIARDTKPLAGEVPSASLETEGSASRPQALNVQTISSSSVETKPKAKGEEKALAEVSDSGNSKSNLRGKASQGKEEALGFGELRSDKPINITADRMDAFQKENRVVFEGNVVAQQEETYLYARRIVADMAPQEQGGGIRKVVAQDNVKITQNDRVATCDRAEFDHLRRTIELHGNPKIWQGKDWIDGEKVLVQLDQEKMTVVGSEDKRVSAVLHPKSQKAEQEEPLGAKEPKSRPGLSAPFAQVASQEPEVPKEPAGKPGTAPSSASAKQPTESAAREEPVKSSAKKETLQPKEAAPPQAAALSAPSLRAEEEAARIAASSQALSQTPKKDPSSSKSSSSETREADIPKESAASFVGRWSKAWQSKDIDAYMAFYSKKFRSGAMDWNGWRAYKAATFKKARSIEVSTEALESKKLGSKLRVSFLQHYRADHHQDKGVKELELVNEDGQWKIIAETWKPLKSGGS